ncbi:hypothetical protein [Roseovarius sp. M141]|nr:hypothetical protein [Roseovarius sp. M141]
MSEIITVGLDLAKNVFQVHGADWWRQCWLDTFRPFETWRFSTFTGKAL